MSIAVTDGVLLLCFLLCFAVLIEIMRGGWGPIRGAGWWVNGEGHMAIGGFRYSSIKLPREFCAWWWRRVGVVWSGEGDDGAEGLWQSGLAGSALGLDWIA
ncbi:hypothetical protein K402DRAFT_77300 [Aulographum hederae CBS 113979]|uniref:Uncharacterized protein n=1 Tax=Aulographum hederae CBS 113979 TaxID=1176131 RepID=A0A6G1HFQ8_9PEZI|nr:hypothetical protein K402DRAFT_77300 [Aulographum hederae CBS 113979]